MVKKSITYVDYNGMERTEDHYFNLTEAEIAEKELGTEGGYVEMINNIVKAKNTPELMKTFKDFILSSYGQKSPDGISFIKIDENGHRLADKFVQTPAYSKFFMELLTDAKKAADFVNEVIPNKKPQNNPVPMPLNN